MTGQILGLILLLGCVAVVLWVIFNAVAMLFFDKRDIENNKKFREIK